MANEMNDNLNDIEKEIALSRREKELEPFKILFEIDLKGNVEPEAWDLYNKCLNLEISMDEFRDQFLELTIKRAQAFGNKASHFQDEVELRMTHEQAKEMFRRKKMGCISFFNANQQ